MKEEFNNLKLKRKKENYCDGTVIIIEEFKFFFLSSNAMILKSFS